MTPRRFLAALAVAGAIMAIAALCADPLAASDPGPATFPWPPNQVAPAAGPAPRHTAENPLCVACLRIRVGRPLVVRGPFPDELDAPFVTLKLADGSFRGFSANAVTYAVAGPSAWSMAGPRRAVMRPGPEGAVDDCGRWITALQPAGSKVFALVHEEHACNYAIGQTGKSVALAASADEGLTWTNLGQVISGHDAFAAGKVTGEGDCGMIDGRDGYLYAYCLRNSDWQTIVARAPLSGFGPGTWRKFRDGAWTEDALGGDATAIGFFGTTAGYLKGIDSVATIANDRWAGGLRLALSDDKVHFDNVAVPLLPVDAVDWQRPASTDLIAYVSLINPADGTNAVDDDFLLAYVYIPPGKTFAERYLVFQGVHLTLEKTPPAAQVGIALTRWEKPGEFMTSTGPVTDGGYTPDAFLGYLLTRQPVGVAAVKLEECLRGGAGHSDHLLTVDGGCEPAGYTRLRTAGWSYSEPLPDTLPLYRCFASARGMHFASNAADCEGRGTMELSLGYALRG